jgi:hypothetical protein
MRKSCEVDFASTLVYGGLVLVSQRRGLTDELELGDSRTAKAGTQIQFSGIDLLTIDLGSRMVTEATTSSDRINYYSVVGIDPFAS